MNDVPSPPLPARTPGRSGPTPPDKRILKQKEFDKKLRAKRDVFNKGRSMSFSSFKLSSKLKKIGGSEKSGRILKYWDKERSEESQGPPRGELDLIDMEKLINIEDLVEEDQAGDKM